MTEIETIKVSLPLKKEFKVAGGGASIKTNLIVILNNRYSGEAAASVKYGPTLKEIEIDLQKGISYLKRRKEINLDALEAVSNYSINSVARSALIGMIINYLSGESQKYPWEVLSLGTPVGIRNSTTIGIAPANEVIESIKSTDHPIIKIKMGGEYDAELIPRLAEVSDREIRIDANGGWTPDKAEEMIFYLSKAGIKIIEQPTENKYIADWLQMKGKSEDVVLLLDEGMNTLEDFNKFAQYIDGVNIKMEKSGGIIEAIKIARKAKETGKKVMLGCMVESSIGIAQSIYMSSLADFHDLDSPQLLETDIAQGIIYDRETIQVDREIIGGPSLKRDVVEKFILH